MTESDIPELRVLLVANTLSYNGGAESLVLNIFNGLKQRPGVKVKLVTLKSTVNDCGYDNPELEKTLNRDPDFYDIDDTILFSVIKSNKVHLRQFTAILNDFKPHIIHSHLFVSELIAHEVLFPGAKYFTHCHDNMRQFRNLSFNTFFNKTFFTEFYEKQRLVKRYLKCDNHFISISADTKNYFENVLPGRLKKNILQLDNAIITKNFRGAGVERDLSVIKMVNVGSFIPIKNQQLIVDITRVLRQRGRLVEVTMLGSGSEFESVKNKVEADNLQQIISMPGTKANVADYYAAANIYVHTCTHEAFGLVFLEAMASGLPVVSLDAKGNRALINEGETGYMLTRQNPDEFADAIEKVLEDKASYKTMSDNAVAFAQKYDIEEYLTKLIRLYRFG